jgi:hypothetical protein
MGSAQEKLKSFDPIKMIGNRRDRAERGGLVPCPMRLQAVSSAAITLTVPLSNKGFEAQWNGKPG